jgi:PKD repeat protein
MLKSSKSVSVASLFGVVVLFLAGVLSGASPGLSQTCSVGSPAKAVDARLWGSLRPGDITPQGAPAQLPDDRDTTDYTGNNLPNEQRPIYMSVEVENGWVFTPYATGIRIWDATGSNAELPIKTGGADEYASGNCFNSSGFFPKVTTCGENHFHFWHIDAPDGDDTIIAVSGVSPVGLTIIDTTNKSAPRLLYQDTSIKGGDTSGSQVYATKIGDGTNDREYAFLASLQVPTGLYLYDMTAARALNKCAEDSTLGLPQCPGVYKNRIGTGAPAIYVHGVRTAAKKNYIAASAGISQLGVELYDVTNPLQPVNVNSSNGRFLTSQLVDGVAMWEQTGRQYLALYVPNGAQIYDVTTCLANRCSSLGSPVKTLSWADYGQSPYGAYRSYISFSRSTGNKPMLYFGAMDQCSGGRQREFLFDVSDATNPAEITPRGTISLQSADGLTTKTIDYWSWYYAGNNPVTGFSRVTPVAAKFIGNVLYRAAWTIFDTHVWTNSSPTPPNASFTYAPTQGIYPGTPVTFTDTSTGTVTSREWTFPADASVSSTTTSPVTASFSQSGPHDVTLTARNDVGPSTTPPQTVNVLNPAPAIGSITHSPPSPLTCQAVTFTANGVTGNPAPTVTWVIQDSGGHQVYPLVGQQAGSSFTLQPALAALSGSPSGTPYTAVATATNTLSSVQAPPHAFTLTSPPDLSFGGPGGAPVCTNCTNGSPPFGSVNLDASATGATDFSWDFGDGVSRGYENGESQYNVAKPSFSFTTTGPRSIRVKIHNCTGAELVSQPLSVTITQVNPLTVDKFEAVGCLGACAFSTGQAIQFNVLVSGDPTGYDYDWNGNGQFQTVTTAPVDGFVPHTYDTAGTYKPVLRIRRGTEVSAPVVHRLSILISSGGGGGGGGGGGSNPSISVSGPTTGHTGDALSFSAAAANCTGNVTDAGWTWTAGGGGTVSGTGHAVTISWTADGVKSVTVTHSACSGAVGSRSVSISTITGPQLAASFTFTPATPKAGDTVSFDGSASTGSPTSWSWTFGDGQTGNGQKVTHAYAPGGPYVVRLEIAKQGDGPGCSLGFCTAATTQTLTVSGSILQADISTDADCISQFGVNQCTAQSGTTVHFTANAPGATSFSWSFGDGGTATGSQVSHAWTTTVSSQTFQVVLTASDGRSTASASRNFVVTGTPVIEKKAVILPFVAQSRGVQPQTSDLYLLNPAAVPMDVILTFLKRGVPETNPPKVTRTIQPGATLYVPDVVRGLFNRENVTGFITVSVDKGGVEPVITAFNTNAKADGSTFSQTVSGLSMSTSTAAGSPGRAAAQVQNLIGLSETSDFVAAIGINNPTQDLQGFTLRLYDSLGKPVGAARNFVAPRLGQRQLLAKDLRDLFGLTNQDDFRIEIGNTTAQLFPYSANLRVGSNDPSSTGAGSAAAKKVYLLGAMNGPGVNKTNWQTDVLISNPSSDVVLTDISYIGTGVSAQSTSAVHLTLQPGETRRLVDAINRQWGLRNTVGVITLDSNAPGGVYPIVQGESYESTNPSKRFGRTMVAMDESQAGAGPNGSQYLVGLRQDAKNGTTLWVFNAGSDPCVFDIVYRGLDGHELGRIPGWVLNPGKVRQLGPAQHKLPAGGVKDGFTVEVQVKSGKVVAAAQVVNSVTNDPAYIQGAKR